jgi:predicted outer membrane repeat protein
MIHNLMLIACIAAALALLLILLFTVIGNRCASGGAILFTGKRARRFSASRRAQRRTGNVVVPQNSLPGGWSLIQRSIRARRDVRIAAR